MGFVAGVPARVAKATQTSDTSALAGPRGVLEEANGVPHGQTSFFLSAYTLLVQLVQTM